MNDELLQWLVTRANANDELMDGTMTPIMNLVTAHEVVFALWQDSAEPNDVGLRIVKGANRLREIVASGVNADCLITAIKCRDSAQAEALCLHAGTDRTH